MKTHQQENKSTSRSVADELTASRGLALPAPSFDPSQQIVIQRSPVIIGEKLLAGSKEEDYDGFWQTILKEYEDTFSYATVLRQIILTITAMGDKQTEWDKKVLSKAIQEIQIEAEYIPHKDLDEDQSGKVKSILEGKKPETKDEEISEKDIHPKALNDITEALNIYAEKEIKNINSVDDEKIDLVSDESDYNTILQRAIYTICNEYGAKMNLAQLTSGDSTASTNLNNAQLQHSTARHRNAGKEETTQAAELAVYWIMSSIGEVSGIISQLTKLHTKSSFGTILSTYADAILKNKKNEKMLSQLAEIRLKWGPITIGPNIYLQVTKKKITLPDQWELYQTLIHEALHSAEHPAFTLFLDTNIPKGLHSNIREGTVEYLTMMLWGKVLQKVKEGTGGNTPATGGGTLSASKSMLTKMKSEYEKGKSSYGEQMQLIATIISVLENGDKRLEAAYFYGNVGVFLPKF